jgi:hypothetical protein
MKIPASAVISDVFQLVKTVEFDVETGGKFLPTRVEVLQDTQHKRRFRCHLWELEYYHVEGAFAAGKKGKARRPVSDEPIFVERTWELSSKFCDFEAPNAEAALRKFLRLLQRRMKEV